MTEVSQSTDYAGQRSQELYGRAQRVIPAGVSSPVRAFRAVGGTPIYLESGRGSTITDADGRSYLDFVMSWGPLILGHAHPEVIERVRAAAADGLTFGTPCAPEVELAERIVDLYPGLEQVRFVSSGTEATMSALRVARAATGRDRIVKFSGCYHGHSDQLLVAAGSGLVTFGEPSSAGVPDAFTSQTAVLPLDDDAALEALFNECGRDIAAVIIEPIPANNGLLIQRTAFLQRLREITRQHGSLLIFDEVITGFRVAPGGAADLLGVTPDLAAFGKVIGGGMPVGAFGGSAEVMSVLAPLGPAYQAGTLSGNPVAMTAGLATLDVMEREHAWKQLEALGSDLEQRLSPIAAEMGGSLVRQGSLFWLNLAPGEAPRTAEAIPDTIAEPYKAIFQSLLQQGVYLAPSAYEVGFLSLAHETADIERLAQSLNAARDSI